MSINVSIFYYAINNSIYLACFENDFLNSIVLNNTNLVSYCYVISLRYIHGFLTGPLLIGNIVTGVFCTFDSNSFVQILNDPFYIEQNYIVFFDSFKINHNNYQFFFKIVHCKSYWCFNVISAYFIESHFKHVSISHKLSRYRA